MLQNESKKTNRVPTEIEELRQIIFSLFFTTLLHSKKKKVHMYVNSLSLRIYMTHTYTQRELGSTESKEKHGTITMEERKKGINIIGKKKKQSFHLYKNKTKRK